MEAGKLRHRVTIQKPTLTQDTTTGEVTTAWTDLHSSIPAAVEPLSVKEYLQSRTDQSETSVRVVIRHRDGLTPDMRILHRGKIYNPQGFLADKVSGLEYLTIPCSEGVNEG